MESDGWLVLDMLWLDGVSERGFAFLPGYYKGQAWEEIVDNCCMLGSFRAVGMSLISTCWDYLGFSKSSHCKRLRWDE